VNRQERDESFMKRALRLARKGRGRTSPNPLVGAVLAREDAVVAEGCHREVGGPHAEAEALTRAGREARGATLYVTLEPCNHYGRTPPCAVAVAEAGVGRVVVGMRDPNPRVKGGGVEWLRDRGIRVDTGVLEEECRRLNQPFIKHCTLGLPWVTLKAAATLDGRIATRTGDSRWITNEESRRFVHALRCEADAILVGIGTVLADDPQLTARLKRSPPCRQPARVVVDTRLRIPLESRLVRTARQVPVWVAAATDGESSEASERLREAGATVLRLPEKAGRVRLSALLEELGRRKVTSLLVEGGGGIHGSFLEEGLADELRFFYAPKVLGDSAATPMIRGGVRERMADAFAAYELKVRRFGQDVLLSGRFRRELY